MTVFINTPDDPITTGFQMLVITRGLPASGKSTLARKYRDEDPVNRVIVEKDKIRDMIGGGFVKDNEFLVHRSSVNMVDFYLGLGKTVIVSDTNLPNKTLKSYMEVADKHKVHVWIVDFTNVDIRVCHSRNLSRASNYPPDDVPSSVIDTMYNKFIKGRPYPLPLPEIKSEDRNDWKPYVAPEGRFPAILVDIDGTLAHMHGRSPYATDASLLTDTVDVAVRELVDTISFGQTRIVLLSGRSEDGRLFTEQWLRKNHIYYDELHMRASGDGRKDDQVKYELFNEHIRDRYDVRFVLDDRDQVVRMWRAIGLKCFQVEYGDF